MRRWTQRGLVRVSGHWFAMVSFAAGVAATGLLHNWLWPQRQTNSPFSGSEINLQILPNGTSLFVQWNRQSSAVLQGYSGVLTVQDGGRQVRLPLDRQQLRAGSTSYTPTSEWAEFRLEIYRDGNHYSGEAMALATGLQPQEAAPADTALVQAVPRPRDSTTSPGVRNPRLREFSPPTPFAATNTGPSEEIPPSFNLAQNKTAPFFPLDDPDHPSRKADSGLLQGVPLPNSEALPLPVGAVSSIKPAQNSAAVTFPATGSKYPSPVAEVPLPRSKAGKLTIRTYDGIILDAGCDTLTEVRVPDEHQYCSVSAATTMFAIRLGDGQTLRFDSVGNLRAQNAKVKNHWGAKTSAGKQIHATVTGAMAGDGLIVVSVE